MLFLRLMVSSISAACSVGILSIEIYRRVLERQLGSENKDIYIPWAATSIVSSTSFCSSLGYLLKGKAVCS